MNLKGRSNKTLTDRITDVVKCKRNSARTYASTIVRLANLFTNGYTDDLKFLKEDSLFEKLKRHNASLHTKRNLTNAVLIALKLEPNPKMSDKYRKYLLTLNKQVDEQAKSGVLTDKQKAKFVDWSEIIKLRKLLAKQLRLSQAMKRKKISGKDMKMVNEHLALCCLTMTPPTRLDWATVRFYNTKSFGKLDSEAKTSENMVIIRRSSVTIVWNQYKTASKHGTVSHELPKDLSRIIKRHVKFLTEHFPKNNRLFLNAKFEGMSRTSFQKLLETLFFRYFRKRLSVSAIRRIYLSSKYSHKMVREAQEDARKMMHSVSTQQTHYIKKTE